MADSTISDFERFSKYFSYNPETGVLSWAAQRNGGRPNGSRAGYRGGEGYRVLTFQGKKYMEHRVCFLLAHKDWPQHVIDHINGDRADNRLANLRDVKNEINMQNIRKAMSHNKSCGLLGVTYAKASKKWHASIKLNRKSIYIGSFETAEEAHLAYVERKRLIHEGCTI